MWGTITKQGNPIMMLVMLVVDAILLAIFVALYPFGVLSVFATFLWCLAEIEFVALMSSLSPQPIIL